LSSVAPCLLSVDGLFASPRRTDAAKQRTVAYLSGRGQRGQMFRPWVLITSYTTASARQCKCGRFSLPLYSKQERPLFTAALEQTSNVPTARDFGRSSGRVWRRASGLPYPASGRRSRLPPLLPSVAFLARVSTHAPRRRRRGRCPPLNTPIRRASATTTNFCHMSPPVWHINKVRI